MKKANISFEKILWTAIYIVCIVMFMLLIKHVDEHSCMIMFMSHFYFLGALVFRKNEVKRFDLFKGFSITTLLIYMISILPISGYWALVPFWLCGFFHIKKISHHELMGHFYGNDENLSEEIKTRDLEYLWIISSLIVTILA